MKKFLLVSTRPEEEALVTEYQAYLRAAGLAEADLELAEFDLIGLPEIDLADYAGVFVAGSPYGNATVDGHVSNTQRWVAGELRDLLAQIIETGTPCIATGTAMTILAEVLGGSVSNKYAQQPQVAEVTLTREGREDPLLAGIEEDFLAYVSHTESCDDVPPGAQRLAWTAECPVQIIRAGENLYAVQFNPELGAEAIERQLRRYADAGDFGVADMDALVETGRTSAGGHQAGRILRNFVAQHR